MVKVRNPLSKSFLLLYFSAATFLSPVQQQSAASVPPQLRASTSSQPLKPLPTVDSIAPLVPFSKKSSPVNPAHETHLLIKLSERRVYLYRDNKVKTSYPIAVGKPGWETPTGTFKILQMERDPAWEHPLTGKVIPPGEDNPLGLRWIGFWTDGSNFIGFHGTPNESVMGKAVSHGCVRMRNKDVVALFEQVAVGTSVIVQP